MLNVADTHQTSRRPKASYRHNDLFSLVAHGTPERAWASMDIRGISSTEGASFVERGSELRDGFVSWFGVNGERAGVLVAALGLQQGGGGSCFAEVSQ